MKNVNGYQIFLMIQLAITKGVIEKELEYDSQWEQGLILYAKYKDSKFSDINEPEYESILKFLDGELTQTFHLDVDVVEVNRYKYLVVAKSFADAKKRILLYLDDNCPDSHESNMQNGIQGYDCAYGVATLDVKDVTEQ